MGSYYKQQLNEWKATLEVSADIVFDIGGAQDPIKGMTKSWNVKDYKIIDLETPHVTKQPPDIVWDMNKEGIWQNEKINGPYMGDVPLIFMLGVMDYVINPNTAMDSLFLLLRKGGTAWVEFPFVYPIHNPKDDEGCRYSEGCIRRLAKQAGLTIEEIIYKTPKPGNNLLTAFYAADGMRAASGVDHNVTGYIVRFSK